MQAFIANSIVSLFNASQKRQESKNLINVFFDLPLVHNILDTCLHTWKIHQQIVNIKKPYNQGTFKNTIHSIVMFIVFISAI